VRVRVPQGSHPSTSDIMESDSNFVFALFDRVDPSGKLAVSNATGAQIRKTVAKRRRAKQVWEKQAIRQNALRDANIFWGSQLDQPN
jgi:hypothetical protein